MKKTVMIIIFMLILTVTAFASPEDETEALKREYDPGGQIEEVVSSSDAGSFLELIKESFFGKLSILKNTAYIGGVAVLMAILKNLSQSASSSTVNMASVAACLAVTLIPGIDAIKSVGTYLKAISAFLTSFTPIFAGVMAAEGKVVSGGTFAYLVLGFASVAAAAAGVIVIPFTTAYLGFSLISGITEGTALSSVCESVKKMVNLILGFVFAVFSALLTIRLVVSSSTDSVSLRGVKFAVNSFVPVVGGALSEAVSAAGGYLKVISNTFGVFGIIVLITIFLPVCADILMWLLTLGISGFISDLLGQKEISGMLASVRTSFSVMWSITAAFFLMSIISIGIMLSFGG